MFLFKLKSQKLSIVNLFRAITLSVLINPLSGILVLALVRTHINPRPFDRCSVPCRTAAPVWTLTPTPHWHLLLQRSDLLCLRSYRLWEVTSICAFKPSSVLVPDWLSYRRDVIAAWRGGDGFPAVGIFINLLLISTVFTVLIVFTLHRKEWRRAPLYHRWAFIHLPQHI